MSRLSSYVPPYCCLDESPLKEEACPNTLPAIKEEEGEQTDEQIPLSPFGIRMDARTRNLEDR